MKLLRLYLLVLAFSIGQTAFAAPTDRDALLNDFSESTGVSQIILQSQQQTRKHIALQVDMLVANMRKAGVSEPSLNLIRELYLSTMEKVVFSWDPEEAARIYSSAIAESMSDRDLRSSIAFYKSPEGKKSQSAVVHAAALMQAYIQESIAKATQPAIDEFRASLRPILEREHENLQRHAAPK